MHRRDFLKGALAAVVLASPIATVAKLVEPVKRVYGIPWDVVDSAHAKAVEDIQAREDADVFRLLNAHGAGSWG